MKEPLVSVVMPSYNSERHIYESIQSIIDQSFKDWELIIVDGHSADKTLDIIQDFMAKDSRIKLMYDEGKGIGPALNLGCKAAKGKYIARMDTDDISMPERLEMEVSYLKKHPSIVMVSSSAEYINENGESMGYMFPYTHQYHLRKHLSVVHPSVMMKKDIFFDAGGYPPIKRAEDLMLWLKMMKKGRIVIIEYPLIKYRLSENSLENSMSYEFTQTVHDKWKHYAVKENLEQDDLNEINHFINDNITNTQNRVFPVRSIENKLLSLFSIIMPCKAAFKSVFFFKNIYGYIKS